MHHGQSRGGTKKTESMYKTRKFYEIRGRKFVKVGENEKFCEIGGKCTEIAIIGGNSKFMVND